MKTLVFDTGPIISMAMNNLLWLLEPLKEKFKGEFMITPKVKFEVIDRPLKSKRYKFQAMQVLKLFEKGVLKLAKDKKIVSLGQELLELSNSIFSSKGGNIKISQMGEMEAIAAAILLGAKAVVVDERTTRMLLENPERLERILEKKTRMPVEIDTEKLKRWEDFTSEIRVIRSTELATISFEWGILDKYVPHIKNARDELLEGLLWGLRLNGCSISTREIAKMHKLERKK